MRDSIVVILGGRGTSVCALKESMSVCVLGEALKTTYRILEQNVHKGILHVYVHTCLSSHTNVCTAGYKIIAHISQKCICMLTFRKYQTSDIRC